MSRNNFRGDITSISNANPFIVSNRRKNFQQTLPQASTLGGGPDFSFDNSNEGAFKDAKKQTTIANQSSIHSMHNQ